MFARTLAHRLCGTADSNPPAALLADVNDANNTVAESHSCCNLACCLLRGEQSYKFAFIFLTSPFAIYSFIDLIKTLISHRNEHEALDGVNSIGQFVASVGLAALFAVGEAYCHYAESRSMTDSSMHHAPAVAAPSVAAADDAAPTVVAPADRDVPPAPQINTRLSFWQRTAVGLHLSSDVSSDMGTILTANVAWCNLLPFLSGYLISEQAVPTQTAIFGALLVLCIAGNLQEALNASASLHKLNAAAERPRVSMV